MLKAKIKIITALKKNASFGYYELVNTYKEEYNQVFESKDEDWRKKHDYKNLKDFGYQADKAEKEEKKEKDEDKADKADQE